MSPLGPCLSYFTSGSLSFYITFESLCGRLLYVTFEFLSSFMLSLGPYVEVFCMSPLGPCLRVYCFRDLFLEVVCQLWALFNFSLLLT